MPKVVIHDLRILDEGRYASKEFTKYTIRDDVQIKIFHETLNSVKTAEAEQRDIIVEIRAQQGIGRDIQVEFLYDESDKVQSELKALYSKVTDMVIASRVISEIDFNEEYSSCFQKILNLAEDHLANASYKCLQKKDLILQQIRADLVELSNSNSGKIQIIEMTEVFESYKNQLHLQKKLFGPPLKIIAPIDASVFSDVKKYILAPIDKANSRGM